MAILQHTAQEIAVLASSDITRPRDLDGRTYAGFGYPNEEPTLKAVIKADGGKGTFKTVTLDTAAYDALYAKRADFVITFAAWEGDRGQGAWHRAADVRVRRLRVPRLLPGRPRLRQPLAGGASRSSPAHSSAATVRGFELAADDPDAAAAMLVAQNPGVFDGNPTLPARRARSSSPRRLPRDESGAVGRQTLAKWQGYSGFLFDQGLLTGPDGKPLTDRARLRGAVHERLPAVTRAAAGSAAGDRRSPSARSSLLLGGLRPGGGDRPDHAAGADARRSARCGTSAMPPSATSSRRWSRRSSACALSVVLAIAAAVALDRWEPVRRAVEPLLVTSQTIPIVAIAPLFVIWFGFGLLPKVLIVVLVTFFPVTIALLDGRPELRGVRPDRGPRRDDDSDIRK